MCYINYLTSWGVKIDGFLLILDVHFCLWTLPMLPPFNIGCSFLLLGIANVAKGMWFMFSHLLILDVHFCFLDTASVAKYMWFMFKPMLPKFKPLSLSLSLSLSLRHTFRWCALYFYWKIKWMCPPWWTNLRWFLIFPWYMWFMFEPFSLSLSRRWCALYFYWKIKWVYHSWWTNLR